MARLAQPPRSPGKQHAAGVERLLYGQRVAKFVRVTDVPVESPRRAYLVECGLYEPDTGRR